VSVGQPVAATDWIAAVRTAAQWRLLGLLFERPRPGWAEEAESLVREVADAELRRVVERAISAANEGEYHRVLGPGGLVSPREVSYRVTDPGVLMANLSCAYDAFAYRPRVEEPLDHIAVETGFAGYLCLKEAFAIANGENESAEQVASARSAFVEDHLRAFATGLAQRLGTLAGSYLCDCGRLLGARVSEQ